MKKKFTILLVLMISAITFAQKMKLKKDQLLFDKTAVANFNREKGIYTLSKLDNTNGVKISVEHCILTNKFYLQFVDSANQNSNQKELTSYSAMNEKKYVLLAIEEAGFVTSAGFQTEALNAFLEGEKSNLAKEFGCTFITEGKEKLAAMNIKTQKNGFLTINNNKPIGNITRNVSLDVIKYEDHTYKFYNTENELIATAQGKMTNREVIGKLTTFDNKTFSIPLEKYFSSTYDFQKDKNIEMVILILIQNGYNL